MTRSIRPVPFQDIRSLPFSFQRWYESINQLIEAQITGIVPWIQVDKAGANITDIPNRAHNNLTAFNGGASGEYFHLTASQHNSLTALNTYTANEVLTSANGYVLGNATSGNITFTLPPASLRTRLHIKKIDSSANIVTVQRAGTDTIEGSNTVSLNTQYKSITLYSNGSNIWYIEGQT